ncbi:hypothetical protein QWY75_00480 [Pontixanthobacter aestiaquae]|uniref:Tetratricopeptide repeat-containing protein n=1 Tax=Pontixanthobacter aestiaquae TaxID=1509367 RepID=A0A844Z931_9SPHN|nr:hypothetical protein [Pontixanthobacter aestiaquae]MDN3644674.1 hypothetical protein [Pontixanthobacter aestiaquae]MXO84318.1 hypothetical protein [Pontixanthobacter aestiaquae]
MALLVSAAALALLQPTPAPADMVDVAYNEMAAEQNAAAIERIEANDALDLDDPARLINLGIANAREGRVALARKLLNAAAHSETRFRLETASGEWVDSRWLARRALARLDEHAGIGPTRVAAR